MNVHALKKNRKQTLPIAHFIVTEGKETCMMHDKSHQVIPGMQIKPRTPFWSGLLDIQELQFHTVPIATQSQRRSWRQWNQSKSKDVANQVTKTLERNEEEKCELFNCTWGSQGCHQMYHSVWEKDEVRITMYNKKLTLKSQRLLHGEGIV